MTIENHEQSPTPSPSQQAAAGMLFYLDTISILDRQAKLSTIPQLSIRRGTSHEERIAQKNLYSKIRVGLIDLYFLNQEADPEARAQAIDSLGEDASVVLSLLEQTLPQIQQKKQERDQQAITLSKLDIHRAILKTARKLSSLTPNEQTYLLRNVGYEAREIEEAGRHVIVSSFLTGVTGIGGITLSAGLVTKEALSPLLSNISDTRAQLLVISSYIIRYIILGVLANQNTRLLHQFETNANVLSTISYLLLKKVYPDNKSLANFAVYFTTMMPTLVKDLIAAGLLTTPIGPSIIAARNVATSTIDSVTIVGGEIVLRRRKNRSAR